MVIATRVSATCGWEPHGRSRRRSRPRSRPRPRSVQAVRVRCALVLARRCRARRRPRSARMPPRHRRARDGDQVLRVRHVFDPTEKHGAGCGHCRFARRTRNRRVHRGARPRHLPPAPAARPPLLVARYSLQGRSESPPRGIQAAEAASRYAGTTRRASGGGCRAKLWHRMAPCGAEGVDLCRRGLSWVSQPVSAGDPVAVELQEVVDWLPAAAIPKGGGSASSLESSILRLNLFCANTGSTVAFRCL